MHDLQPRGASPAERAVLGAAWLGLAGTTVAAVLYATSRGIGISPDSTWYLEVARDWMWLFAFGARDVFEGSGGWAPLYPALVGATAGIFGVEPVAAARWLHVLALPANLFLIGTILRRAVPEARYTPWIGAVLWATNLQTLEAHSMAWSEPTFFAFLLTGFLALDAYLFHPTPGRLAALTATAAATCLARFAGVAFVAAAMIALWCWSPGRPWKRGVAALSLAALSVLPILTWGIVRPGWTAFAVHVPSPEWFGEGIMSAAGWAVPASVPMADPARVALALVALAAVGTLTIAAPPAQAAAAGSRGSRLPSVWLLFAVAYGAVLVLTVFIWDAAMLLSPRIMAPFWMVLMLLVVSRVGRSGLQWRTPDGHHRFTVYTAAALVCAFGFGTLLAAGRWLEATHREGLGYNSVAWQQSAIMRVVRELPAGTFVVSNGDDAIAAITGRRVGRLPDRINPATLEPSPNYAVRMERLGARLRQGGFVVLIDAVTAERRYIPDETNLEDVWDLELVTRAADGAIYRWRRAG